MTALQMSRYNNQYWIEKELTNRMGPLQSCGTSDIQSLDLPHSESKSLLQVVGHVKDAGTPKAALAALPVKGEKSR